MKKIFKYYFLGSFSTLIFLFLVSNFLILYNKDFLLRSYYRLISFQNSLKNSKNLFKKNYNFGKLNEEFTSCLPDLITEIPNNSSVIIGHAYGRRDGTNLHRMSLSPKVSRFLRTNKNKIDSLFLTGDVFVFPSKNKWEKLYRDFSDYFEIYIAPGNHDIGNKENEMIFRNATKLKQPFRFPFLINASGFKIILDNSNEELDPKSYDELLKNIPDKVLVLQHHVLIKELSEYGGNTKFIYNKDIFEEIFLNQKNVNIIYGNGGMYHDKPRIACYVHKNLRHIINGIGEYKKDNILVLNNGLIYRYIIGN